MNKKPILLIPLLLALAFAFKPILNVKSAMETVKRQLRLGLQAHTDTLAFPRSTNPNGTLNTVPSQDWTSGFYAGNLWQVYEYTKDPFWKQQAERWTAGLEKEKMNTATHDLGFMLYCSFGNGYRLTKNPAYKEVLLQGAKSLSTRFNPKTGCIKSWDKVKWGFPVIIDNMMNLELLFWATKMTGDSSFYKIAVTHALTTMKNHYRPDNSSYHVVDYDPQTGKVLAKVTHQGFSDESAWARGQAWGLYGYTMTYRETKDKRFLEQAQKIADFLISHPNLPKDKVPYWDFNDTDLAHASRDASAAAITSSALLELSKYAGKKGTTYKQMATQILESLSTPAYLAKEGSNNHFLLMHSTGHRPHKSEVDVPLIYADYYYIEGLRRYQQMGLK
jgi:unsaturated chondroitin disaccharide hydrolase